jgi:hypothetical protein
MTVKDALRRQPWFVIVVSVLLLILLLALWGRLARQRDIGPKAPLPIQPATRQ